MFYGICESIVLYGIYDKFTKLRVSGENEEIELDLFLREETIYGRIYKH